MRFEMPARHLLVWFAAGAACWCLIATAALLAPQALLALGALLALPWLRRPAADAPTGAPVGAVEPVLLGAPDPVRSALLVAGPAPTLGSAPCASASSGAAPSGRRSHAA